MLSVTEVHKSFGGNEILKGISFDVIQGEIVTLIGKIGSGKSTIINLICGLIKPESGKIFINNCMVDPSNRDYIKDLGFLLSGDYLIDDFSTILYWECIGKLLHLNRRYVKNKIKFLIDLCEITNPGIPINQLSSGNKMLVKIGTMLLNDPKILVLDEPFIHLDIEKVNKIEDILSVHNSLGGTIFFTSHQPEPIFRISKKLLLLDNGIISGSLDVKKYGNYDSFRNNLSDYFRN